MLVCRISLEDGRCSPIDVNPIFSRRFSSDFPDALDVERAVFIVLTLHLMNLFDLG